MQITAVLCVRNEAAFLLDWVAHHRACGVTHIVALSNDCDDGTDTMLDRLQDLGGVTHIRNDPPYDQAGVQFSALKRADQSDAVRGADWLLALDIDEFVNVHVGARTLPDLIQTLPEATAITLTWRLFGNDGVVGYKDCPVPQQFTAAAPRIMLWPWRAAMFKTLYRNDGTYRKLGVHRPRGVNQAMVENAQWFDGEGRALPGQFRRERIYSNYGRSNYALAQLNHYPLGAVESYVLKADRGRAVHQDQRLGMDYWVERNWCAEQDRSILGLAAQTEALRADLARDPVLGPLHDHAVAWRHTRFAALMQHEPNRALYARLLMTPPSVPIGPSDARDLLGHATAALPDP